MTWREYDLAMLALGQLADNAGKPVFSERTAEPGAVDNDVAEAHPAGYIATPHRGGPALAPPPAREICATRPACVADPAAPPRRLNDADACSIIF